ncbi:Dps family protein [Chelatococcus reniformis]|nr:DNA starvation/stationary phase protection protein [Chelatococcus reniformis]
MAKASTPKGSPARPPAARRAAAKPPAKKSSAVAPSRVAPNRLDTPTDLSPEAVLEISDALKALLADTFTLYIKTKNFHWHVSGPHFRDYHLLLDEQAEQIFESTDDLAERARKIGGTTLRSIGQIAKLSRISDNEAEYVDPRDMLLELVADNKAMVASLREAHGVADKHEDFATTSLIENFIDATERRTWFLFEASRRADNTGH